MDERKLSNHYYSSQGYWKGYDAINKLADVTNIDKDIVRMWLERQIYLSKPKYIPRFHYGKSSRLIYLIQ